MKQTILLGILLAGMAHADFEPWTNKDGKTAELELVNVVDQDGEKAGEFKKEFQHGVTGIPSLIVCDLEGKNLGNFRGNLPGITALVKD